MIHVTRGATSLGAFSEEEVSEGLRTGRFLPTDLGWREGMANWQVLSEFPEFGGVAPVAPPPQQAVAASGVGQIPVPRSGLPWDERQTKGLFNAFLETLQMVLSKPSVAFTAMKHEGGLGDPLLYAVIGGTFGVVFAVVYNFVLRSFTPFGERHGAFAHFVGGLGWILLLILAPVFVVIGTFISSAILHICLMIAGGAPDRRQTCRRRAGCARPPGLARAHETDTGRAVIAVLLPLIVCCGGFLLIAMMFGALGAWSASQH